MLDLLGGVEQRAVVDPDGVGVLVLDHGRCTNAPMSRRAVSCRSVLVSRFATASVSCGEISCMSASRLAIVTEICSPVGRSATRARIGSGRASHLLDERHQLRQPLAVSSARGFPALEPRAHRLLAGTDPAGDPRLAQRHPLAKRDQQISRCHRRRCGDCCHQRHCRRRSYSSSPPSYAISQSSFSALVGGSDTPRAVADDCCCRSIQQSRRGLRSWRFCRRG